MSKAVPGVVMSFPWAAWACWLWLTAWVLRVGTLPRRGCRSANPATLEAKAPWEKPVSPNDGFEAWLWKRPAEVALEAAWPADPSRSCMPSK